MSQKFNAIKLNEKDNVAVALTNIKVGDSLLIKGISEEVQVMENIPFGHKIATTLIRKNEKIVKYGECMGITTEDIPTGHHVHVFNVRGLNEDERLKILEEYSHT